MTINKAYIKYTRKVHWLTFCNNVTWGSCVLITGIINLNNFSHTAGLLLRNLFSILSPIPPAAPTFGEPYVAWNTLQQPPILTPPASPSLRFFTCSTACLQGVTWSGEGRKRGKGKADKPYSVATIGPMILLTLIFLFKSFTLISHQSNIVVKKSLLKPWEENMTCHHYTYALKYFKITFYQHLQNCGSSFSFPMPPEALHNHSITSPPFPLPPLNMQINNDYMLEKALFSLFS